MRYFLTVLIFISISFSSFSQAPQGFNYQAIVRDATGNVRSNEGVQFQFEIQDSFFSNYLIETFLVLCHNMC